MFRARSACARFSTHFKTRPFCSSIIDGKNKKNSVNNVVDGKIESNVTTFNELYRQLDNLDFNTAVKIISTQPPKKKKFGLDFHLVQLFFACMPSLAVFLVAQYARYEMRKMEAELEEKKKQEEEAKRKQEKEEEKDKEVEQIATDAELLEVKVRLGKLEEAVKEIAVETKKQSAVSITKTLQNAGEAGEKDKSKSESNNSGVQDDVTKQKSIGQIRNADPDKARSMSPVSDASQKNQKGENRIGEPSQDAKR